MYARITIIQLLPGKTDEAIAIYRDSVAPAAKQQKGFKGVYLLADRKMGKTISIAFWETEADMKASESSDYYKQQFAKLAPFDATRPALVDYNVNLLETS